MQKVEPSEHETETVKPKRNPYAISPWFSKHISQLVSDERKVELHPL